MVDHELPPPAPAKRHQTLRRPRKALVQRLRRRTSAVKLAFFRHVDMDFPPSAEIIRPESR
jgi:hypothetical protein